MDPNHPNYSPYSQNHSNSQNYQNFESFLNTDDSQFSQYYQNSQFSPNLNQVPISEQVKISENISCDLFGNKKKKVVKNKWSVKEDVAFMSCWCLISEDGTVGKNQKVTKVWERVHDMYEEARKEKPEELNERNIEMMRSRWKRINESCNKLMEALKEAHTRYRSGMSQGDIDKEAHEIYFVSNKHKFTDLVVYNEVLSKHPKWQVNFDRAPTRPRAEDEEDTEESGGTSKRSKTSEEGQYSNPTNPETPGSGSSTISRPIGRDKAKKGKGKVVSDEVAEQIRAMRITRETEVEAVRERINIQREREQRKKGEKKMELQLALLSRLMDKDHLLPEEEEMKHHLLTLFK